MLWSRLVVALAVGLALVVSGCGGGGEDGKREVTDPVAEALAHVSRDAALVVVAKSDFRRGEGGVLRDLLERFPGSELVVGQVKSHFEKGGVEFDRDIAPLLGNDVVLAVPSGASAGERHGGIAVTVAPDEGKLDDVVSAAVKRGALREAAPRARYRGAALYARRRGALAVKGPVVVVAEDTRAVRAALALRARGGGLTPGVLRSRLAGMPGDALVRVIGDARPLLAHTRTMKEATAASAAKAAKLARLARVPWFAALRRFAATVTAAGDGLRLRFRAETPATGRSLRESAFPLATGPEPPAPVGDAPLVVGIRDPAQVIAFAQQAAEAIAPGKLRALSVAKTVIEGTRGIDLDEDVVAQLTGTTTVRSDLRRVSVRAQVRDPRAMATTLDRLLPLMPSLLHGLGIRDASVSKRSGRYVIERDGEQLAVYVLDRDALVVTTDRTEEVGGPGSPRPSPRVPKGPGALVARLDAAGLQTLVIRLLGLPPAARFALGALGDVTLAVRMEHDRLEGRAAVQVSP